MKAPTRLQELITALYPGTPHEFHEKDPRPDNKDVQGWDEYIARWNFQNRPHVWIPGLSYEFITDHSDDENYTVCVYSDVARSLYVMAKLDPVRGWVILGSGRIYIETHEWVFMGQGHNGSDILARVVAQK